MAQFITWLKNQQDRTDAIGRLAMAASRDQEFPKANKLNLIVDYLKRKGANDKLLDTVENAYAEFENAPRRKSRKATPLANEPKQPAAKKVSALETPKPAAVRPVPTPTAVIKPVPAAPAPKTRSAAEKPAKAVTKTTGEVHSKATPKTAAAKPDKPAKAGKVTESTTNRRQEAPAPKPVPHVPKAQQRTRAIAPKTEEPQVRRLAQEQPQQNRPETQRSRQPKSETGVGQLPDRLLPLQRQMADASAVLDAQFGNGYSAKNAAQVLDFARMLLTAEQNRMMHFTFADLAEALHRVASRLDNMMRQPF